jgi:hypothetical protein
MSLLADACCSSDFFGEAISVGVEEKVPAVLHPEADSAMAIKAAAPHVILRFKARTLLSFRLALASTSGRSPGATTDILASSLIFSHDRFLVFVENRFLLCRPP